MSKHVHAQHHDHETGCLPLPKFERVKYFYGQLLGVREFQSEQAYFLEKHRLHNRYLHGYGVVCGLDVEECRKRKDPCDPPDREDPKGTDKPEPPPPPSAKPPTREELEREHATEQHVERVATPPHPRPDEICVQIDCGLALDCQGNEITVPWPAQFDLLCKLDCDERELFLRGRVRAFISICFHEKPIDPVRPITADQCGGLVPECLPSRLRDDFCIDVSLKRPPHDRSCSPCARPCCEPCLLLAEVWWNPRTNRLVIDNSERRVLSLTPRTVITGISWVHDGNYRPDDADKMLQDGLRLEFSDDIHSSTLRRGVIDVWVIEGGGGKRGSIYSAGVRIFPGNDGSAPGFSRSVTVRVHSHRGDRLDPGDRVLITLRSAFVLDRCCRAIDGDHIGGLVPQLASYHNKPPTLNSPISAPCLRPEPRTFASPTTGDGTYAGPFESWFYVEDDDKE